MKPSGDRVLTMHDARMIRASNKSLKQLAEQYGVAFVTIGRIKRYETYKEQIYGTTK